MPYSLPQKPNSIADLVGLAIRLFRLEWKPISQRLLWPSLFSSLAVSAIQIVATYISEQRGLGGGLTVYLSIIFVAFLFVCWAQWLLAIRACAVLRSLWQVSADYKEAVQYANRRKWSVGLVYFLGTLLPLSCLMVFMIVCFPLLMMKGANLIVACCLFVLGFFLVISLALTALYATLLFSVLSLEDVNLGEVFSRAGRLSSRFLFRGGSFMVLLWLVVNLITMAFSLILTPLEVYESYTLGPNNMSQLPFWIHLLRVIWSTILNIASMGMALTAAGFYYRDVLIRAEGLDLLERLEAIARGKTADGGASGGALLELK